MDASESSSLPSMLSIVSTSSTTPVSITYPCCLSLASLASLFLCISNLIVPVHLRPRSRSSRAPYLILTSLRAPIGGKQCCGDAREDKRLSCIQRHDQGALCFCRCILYVPHGDLPSRHIFSPSSRFLIHPSTSWISPVWSTVLCLCITPSQLSAAVCPGKRVA